MQDYNKYQNNQYGQGVNQIKVNNNEPWKIITNIALSALAIAAFSTAITLPLCFAVTVNLVSVGVVLVVALTVLNLVLFPALQKRQLLAELENNPYLYSYLPPNWKADSDVIDKVIREKECVTAIGHVPTTVDQYQELVIDAIKIHYAAFQSLKSEIKEEKEVFLAFLESAIKGKYDWCGEDKLLDKFKEDQDVVSKLLVLSGKFLKKLPDEVKKDRKFVKIAMESYPLALFDADEVLQNDKDLWKVFFKKEFKKSFVNSFNNNGLLPKIKKFIADNKGDQEIVLLVLKSKLYYCYNTKLDELVSYNDLEEDGKKEFHQFFTEFVSSGEVDKLELKAFLKRYEEVAKLLSGNREVVYSWLRAGFDLKELEVKEDLFHDRGFVKQAIELGCVDPFFEDDYWRQDGELFLMAVEKNPNILVRLNDNGKFYYAEEMKIEEVMLKAITADPEILCICINDHLGNVCDSIVNQIKDFEKVVKLAVTKVPQILFIKDSQEEYLLQDYLSSTKFIVEVMGVNKSIFNHGVFWEYYKNNEEVMKALFEKDSNYFLQLLTYYEDDLMDSMPWKAALKCVEELPDWWKNDEDFKKNLKEISNDAYNVLMNT